MSVELEIPFGYIYRIENKVNGKSYIGLRCLRLDKSWRDYLGSGRLIKQAIEKYGKECFTKTFIKYSYSKQSLYELEIFYIKQEKLIGKGEYNLFVGIGAGGDTFSSLSGDDLNEIKKRMSTGLKKGYESGRLKIWNKGLTSQTNAILKTKSEKAIALGTYKNLPQTPVK